MIIVGIDEVGRGCWAGPLVAGAVILKGPILGLKDSKKLSKKQRETLAAIVKAEAAAIGLGWVWPQEIDRDGLTVSVRRAMELALGQIADAYDEVIVDGSHNFLADNPLSRALIKADDSVPAVSAASIVAKVARDSYMETKAAQDYPMHGFDKHVGYGTALHIAALKTYGPTPLHRMSYKPLKKFVLESNS